MSDWGGGFGGFLRVFCILEVYEGFFGLGYTCLTRREMSVTENKTGLILL